MPRLAAPDPSSVVLTCSNKGATGEICGKSQHHCYEYRYGGGVDRKHAAVARSLADSIHTQRHQGVHRAVDPRPSLVCRMARLNMHAWILSLIKTAAPRAFDVAIVSPFSCSPALIGAGSKRPGHMP